MLPRCHKLEILLFLQFTVAAFSFLLFISLLETGLASKTHYKISSGVQNQAILPSSK
jgi:hypothetical protein